MDSYSGVYSSKRINRMEVQQKEGNESGVRFGNVMTSIPAQNYQGKKIKFSGYVKLKDGSSGSGHLWLRVDNPEGKVGFFDNMGENPVTEPEWKPYEIIGTVDANSKSIVLGCFLVGAGDLYVDDLKLCYQEGSDWKEIPLGNGDFESDEIGTDLRKHTWGQRGEGYSFKRIDTDSHSKIHCIQISSDPVEDKRVKAEPLFAAHPEAGEVIQKEIGSGISCIIPLVLYGKEDHTWPVSDDAALVSKVNGVRKNEFSLDLKLGDVIIAWNTFQHFYPYFDIARTDWNRELEKALQKAFKDPDMNAFLVTLQEMTAALKDGHMSVSHGPAKWFTPPIAWEFIEHQLVITGVCAEGTGLRPGDIVTRINGQTVEEYFAPIRRGISAPTEGWMNYMAEEIGLEGVKNSELNVEVNGQTLHLKRSGTDCEAVPFANKTAAAPYRILDKDKVYLNLSKVSMKTIDSLMPLLKDARVLICDLRGYPNDNHDLLSHLLKNKDTDTCWMQIPQFIYPDQEKQAGCSCAGWELEPKAPHLNARVFFLTDGSAISYAESYMGFVEGYKLATIVGQPTAGTNGNVNLFVLPGSVQFRFTGMKVVRHDGTQQHGIGIRPQVLVTKTIQGVKEGRDEFLEKALELAGKPE
ncbi:MAG TPA: S41 family peptidase, partial [Bacteroidia bacterium]|nr:S41 family peptidase [Bacteroidia bacterium]